MKISKLFPLIDIPYSKDVYSPSDDSLLFLDYLDTDEFESSISGLKLDLFQKQEEISISILDMGCGTGILGFLLGYKLSELLINDKLKDINVFFADKNPAAIKLTKNLIKKNKPLVNFCHNIFWHYFTSDLFNYVSIKNKFDIIVFNAPYLPSEPNIINKNIKKIIDLSWDGGDTTGNKTLLDFFSQLKEYIFSHTSIYFITSSLANIEQLINRLQYLGFKSLLLQSIHIFFEDILLFRANL